MSHELGKFESWVKNKYQMMYKRFEERYNTSVEDMLKTIPAAFVIWEINTEANKEENNWLKRRLAEVRGVVLPFLNNREYVELAFEPLQQFHLKFEDLNIDYNPWIWVMIEAQDTNGKFELYNLHEFAEPIKFSEDHQILIEQVDSSKLGAVDMEVFNHGLPIRQVRTG